MVESLVKAFRVVIEAWQEAVERVGDLTDPRVRKRSVKRLSKQARGVDALGDVVKDRVSALGAAAEAINDRRLKREAKRLQKAVKDFDTRKLSQHADKLSDRLAQASGRKQQRRVFPIPLLVIAAIGGAAAFFLYDGRRRQMVAQRVNSLQGEAQRRVPGVMGTLRSRGGVGGNGEQQRLKSAVESAIQSAAPALASAIRVEVEGRTVYLRGSAPDRAQLDAAVDRAQGVEGIAAVINLVSVVPQESAPSTTPS